MRTLALLIAVTAGLLTSSAQADSLRCQQQLVEMDDSVLSVEDACGMPARRVAIIGDNDNRVGTAYYYRGKNGKADRKVIFRAGRVVHIERLQ